MANFVTKKDGTKVPFDKEKIKSAVAASSLEAGLSQEEATELAGKVLDAVVTAFEGQEEVASSEIRERVLSELDVMSPAVSESWKKYEESKES